ncbi:MAG: hypothetical protein OEW48_19360 [Phycisphaerae bacterium]|nr:hypothetical protein [Phycisphaerae bacterium]
MDSKISHVFEVENTALIPAFCLRLVSSISKLGGGEPCPVCGSTIERVPVQNRGTYFCPRCQPLRPRRSK